MTFLAPPSLFVGQAIHVPDFEDEDQDLVSGIHWRVAPSALLGMPERLAIAEIPDLKELGLEEGQLPDTPPLGGRIALVGLFDSGPESSVTAYAAGPYGPMIGRHTRSDETTTTIGVGGSSIAAAEFNGRGSLLWLDASKVLVHAEGKNLNWRVINGGIDHVVPPQRWGPEHQEVDNQDAWIAPLHHAFMNLNNTLEENNNHQEGTEEVPKVLVAVSDPWATSIFGLGGVYANVQVDDNTIYGAVYAFIVRGLFNGAELEDRLRAICNDKDATSSERDAARQTLGWLGTPDGRFDLPAPADDWQIDDHHLDLCLVLAMTVGHPPDPPQPPRLQTPSSERAIQPARRRLARLWNATGTSMTVELRVSELLPGAATVVRRSDSGNQGGEVVVPRNWTDGAWSRPLMGSDLDEHVAADNPHLNTLVVADKEAPIGKDLLYSAAQMDWFGRWSDWSTPQKEASLNPPPPPPPALQAHFVANKTRKRSKIRVNANAQDVNAGAGRAVDPVNRFTYRIDNGPEITIEALQGSDLAAAFPVVYDAGELVPEFGARNVTVEARWHTERGLDSQWGSQQLRVFSTGVPKSPPQAPVVWAEPPDGTGCCHAEIDLAAIGLGTPGAAAYEVRVLDTTEEHDPNELREYLETGQVKTFSTPGGSLYEPSTGAFRYALHGSDRSLTWLAFVAVTETGFDSSGNPSARGGLRQSINEAALVMVKNRRTDTPPRPLISHVHVDADLSAIMVHVDALGVDHETAPEWRVRLGRPATPSWTHPMCEFRREAPAEEDPAVATQVILKLNRTLTPWSVHRVGVERRWIDNGNAASPPGPWSGLAWADITAIPTTPPPTPTVRIVKGNLPGDIEIHPGPIEINPGDKKVRPGPIEIHPGDIKIRRGHIQIEVNQPHNGGQVEVRWRADGAARPTLPPVRLDLEPDKTTHRVERQPGHWVSARVVDRLGRVSTWTPEVLS